MRYFYEKKDIGKPCYGRAIPLDHPVYKLGTLFEIDEKGLIFTQLRFHSKYAYWDTIDFWLANDIYLHPGFQKYFDEHATEKPYPIIEIRSAMWALRMKPLPKQDWERYF